jgi:protein-tyrosine phosphatase
MNLTSGFNEKDMEMLRNSAIVIEKVTGIMKVVSSCGGSLWIGSRACAARQDTFTLYNVQAVLNVSDDVPFYYSDQEDVEIFGRRIEKFRVPVRDLPSEDLKRYFMQATDFIKGCLDENKSVLVHCSMGISRSATVVIAYLIRFEKLTLVEAYGKVKSARDCICPNFVSFDTKEISKL